MDFSFRTAIDVAGYISTRHDVSYTTLNNILFHAQALNLLFSGRRLFKEGFRLSDDGIIIPSVLSNALIVNGHARVSSKCKLPVEVLSLIDMATQCRCTPKVKTIMSVGVLDNFYKSWK